MEGLNSGLQMLQVRKKCAGPPPCHGQEGCSKDALGAVGCARRFLGPGLAAATQPHRALLSRAPDGGELCRVFPEHIKLLEGDYPGTALQPFC